LKTQANVVFSITVDKNGKVTIIDNGVMLKNINRVKFEAAVGEMPVVTLNRVLSPNK
jgi:hypothetical protein